MVLQQPALAATAELKYPTSSHLKASVERNASLDILKLLMAFSVVALHAGFLGEYSELGQYLTVNGIFRVAVPVFLVISGFYFYPVLLSQDHYRWLKRIALLYFFWMAFYSYYWFSLPEFSFANIATLVMKLGVGYWHLWYVAGMLGAAVVLIVFRSFSSALLLCASGLFFFVGVLIQYAGNYHVFGSGTALDTVTNEYWLHRNFLFFSFPFFCVGYLIHKHAIHQKVSHTTALVATLIGLLLIVFESYFNFIQPSRDGGLDNYASLILVCPALFILFSQQNIRFQSKGVALYAAAIYFIHALVLNILTEHTELAPTSLAAVTIVISLLAAYLLVQINRKLKFIL